MALCELLIQRTIAWFNANLKILYFFCYSKFKQTIKFKKNI